MTGDRIEMLERRVGDLGGAVYRMDGKLDNITDTLSSLVRIEERQVSANEKLTNGAIRMHDHENRLRALEMNVPDNLDKRLVSIETKIPGLVESRKWVVMGVLAGIGMMGIAVLKLVFIK